jgi:hypothetical protein
MRPYLASNAFLAIALVACQGPASDETGDSTDTGDTLDQDTFPADPRPFTLTISGAMAETLAFDEPSCTQPLYSQDLRVFWRNAARVHTFVLVAELLGTWGGLGTYAADGVSNRIRLQEEAGGMGRYYAVDLAQGDGGSIEVVGTDAPDEETRRAWGSFEFSGMHGSDGAITATPMPVPIWCADVQ